MTIMFAGGMTAAVPSMMPGIFAEGASSASGVVSISSAKIQGASILEIVIDDPAISALDQAIGQPSLAFAGANNVALKPAQATDGKWYAYIVDDLASTTADDLSGLNFGTDCAATLAFNDGTTVSASWGLNTNECYDPDGPNNTTAAATENADSNNAYTPGKIEVLNDAPSLNKNSSANNGQIYAASNSTVDTQHRSSGETSAWPFIHQVNMAASNTVTYGGESVQFDYGSTNSDISIAVSPDTYADGADVNVIITDPGLNIDPTEIDKWVFGTLTTSGSETVARGFANGTDGSSLTTLDTIGFGEASTVALTDANSAFCTSLTVEETGDATGVFVSALTDGASNCDTVAAPVNHSTGTFAYGGESARHTSHFMVHPLQWMPVMLGCQQNQQLLQ